MRGLLERLGLPRRAPKRPSSVGPHWRSLVLSFAAAFPVPAAHGQSAVHGLTPGESSRAEVERSLGEPLRVESDTQAEYPSGDAAEKLFVLYGEDGRVVERIELVYPEGQERSAVLGKFRLPETPDRRQANYLDRLEEYYGAAAIVLTHRGSDATSPIHRVSVHGRAAFDTALARAEGSAAREAAAIRPMQLENEIALDGTNLTYYPRSSVDQCRADCENNAMCKGFSWIKAGTYNPGDSAMCYLVSAVTRKNPARGHISAVKESERALLVAPLCEPADPSFEHDTNRYGGDFRHQVLEPRCPSVCAAACKADARCKAWTFVRAGHESEGCWLKDQVPPASRNGCCVSGTVAPR